MAAPAQGGVTSYGGGGDLNRCRPGRWPRRKRHMGRSVVYMTEPLVTAPAGGSADSEDALRTWWRRLSGLNGLIALAIGIILLVWPEETLAVVAVLLGVWLIVSALVQLFQALRP